MGNLFTQKNQYDDEGNLLVNQVTAIERGELTLSTGGTTIGSIASMYDLDDTTHYQFVNAVKDAQWALTWDMKKKVKFNNLYVYAWYDQTGSSTTSTILLQTSDDGTTWTTKDSKSGTSAAQVDFNLFSNEITCRYIRIAAAHVGSADTTNIGVYTIKGVLA